MEISLGGKGGVFLFNAYNGKCFRKGTKLGESGPGKKREAKNQC